MRERGALEYNIHTEEWEERPFFKGRMKTGLESNPKWWEKTDDIIDNGESENWVYNKRTKSWVPQKEKKKDPSEEYKDWFYDEETNQWKSKSDEDLKNWVYDKETKSFKRKEGEKIRI